MTHQHQITDAKLAGDFVLAGKAKLTLVSIKTGTRFTFKIKRSEDSTIWFVSVLNGPDNWENYKYIGFIGSELNGLIAGRKGCPDAPSFKAFDWFFRHVIEKNEIPKQLHVWHEGQCGACGRALTVPASIATGFGPHCAEKLGIALVDPEFALGQEIGREIANDLDADPEDDRHSQDMADKFAISF